MELAVGISYNSPRRSYISSNRIAAIWDTTDIANRHHQYSRTAVDPPSLLRKLRPSSSTASFSIYPRFPDSAASILLHSRCSAHPA